MRYLALLLSFAAIAAFADDDSCFTVGLNEHGFQDKCRPKQSSNAADPHPSASDAFSTNPAALPVHSTPWGLEVIGSSEPDKVNLYYGNFGLIHGFKNFGAGIGTDTGGTFYSNRASAPVEHNFPSIPAFNLGMATVLPFYPDDAFIVPVIGGAYKYDPDSDVQGWTAGTNFVSRNFSLGVSYEKEPSDKLVPIQTAWDFTLAMAGGPFDFDFTYGLLHYETSTGDVNDFKSYIGTVSVTVSFITLLAGARIVDSAETDAKRTQLYGVIFQIIHGLRVAYLYDYRPHSHSIGIQTLLF